MIIKRSEDELSEGYILACFMCGKKITATREIREGLCLDCMAFIVQHLDTYPHEDYPLFIDFAYAARNRLVSGESIDSVFKDVPEGFWEWLDDNYKKTGFGMTADS